MHLRRALLLFAIVLGLAAVAASVSRTERGRPAPSPPPPPPVTGPETARPGTGPPPDPGTRTLRFEQAHRREVRKLPAGQAATVVVALESFGQAELQGVGTRTVEPGTPASFDVYSARPQRLAVRFLPASGGRPVPLGSVRVVATR